MPHTVDGGSHCLDKVQWKFYSLDSIFSDDCFLHLEDLFEYYFPFTYHTRWQQSWPTSAWVIASLVSGRNSVKYKVLCSAHSLHSRLYFFICCDRIKSRGCTWSLVMNQFEDGLHYCSVLVSQHPDYLVNTSSRVIHVLWIAQYEFPSEGWKQPLPGLLYIICHNIYKI